MFNNNNKIHIYIYNKYIYIYIYIGWGISPRGAGNRIHFVNQDILIILIISISLNNLINFSL